ncbi:DUF4097 family beta strand repeat-containing protein [Saccharothrix luteola]|uniref:DUF4097 family beta strand repeat-containing protein n=1 Tax=Saccharothrix luteola TaxID=2893018 RepID=UPI001E4D6798|nr:DUF4097 family beta strand repeat-containing protein [Saccharothrix luteola]MCC8247129.1 DUF4097 domain-containing protein [Saccharothrix luteola]MCC8249830.1 DUF4097 domain-containing protein [Saccharothrix luteola]
MPSFTTPAPVTAALTTAGAHVRVTAGDRADTVVHVEPLDSANKTDVKVAERTKIDFTDGTLSIKTTKSGDKTGSVAITVELPAGSALVLNTAWSDVRATGPLGACELNTASGHVLLDRVAALRGNLGGGTVQVDHVAGAVDVDGGTAGLRLGEVDGTVRYQGTTGEVWIGHARSDIDLGGSNGAFTVDHADGSVTARAANCPIRIGHVTRGQVELANASGGIEIGVPDDATAEVDANSTKGVVRNTLPAPTNPTDTVKIHARTRLDDIVIHRATA